MTASRQGDPAAGGSTRQPIMTAYRQQALVAAAALAAAEAAGTAAPTGAPGRRPRDLKAFAPDAPKILRTTSTAGSRGWSAWA